MSKEKIVTVYVGHAAGPVQRHHSNKPSLWQRFLKFLMGPL